MKFRAGLLFSFFLGLLVLPLIHSEGLPYRVIGSGGNLLLLFLVACLIFLPPTSYLCLKNKIKNQKIKKIRSLFRSFALVEVCLVFTMLRTLFGCFGGAREKEEGWTGGNRNCVETTGDGNRNCVDCVDC